MFPTIKTLDDLVPHIESNKQIRVKADEATGHIVVCYMVQDEDTFAGTDLQYAVEARGITFHPDGTIAARTLHKFFNIGEHESVQPQNLIWADVDRIMEKRDGSMVTPVLMANGTVRMKTKKTFTSRESEVATELLHRIDNDQNELEWTKEVLRNGLTPTFEFTSPRFPIVLKYETEELTLLHIRENVSGRYLTEAEILALNPPFPVVPNLKDQFFGDGVPTNLVSWEKLRHAAEIGEGLEGWVIQFKSGDMVKLKTAWYVSLHHSVTFTRWRDIARSVVADQADDLKGAFAMTGRSIEPILKVERGIKETIELATFQALSRSAIGLKIGASAKDMALAHKENPLFGQIMRLFRGQEVDWMEWYAKNHLENDWGLEVVGDAE
jgi:RNA ligase